MKTTTHRTALFGPYTLDLHTGEMRKFGTKVKMGEQTFQILRALLETPGELVTREELRAKVWAGDTFVDFDHGLNSAVQRLRDCLSDSAENPRCVETVPRRGYRFVGQVEWSDGAPPSEMLAEPCHGSPVDTSHGEAQTSRSVEDPETTPRAQTAIAHPGVNPSHRTPGHRTPTWAFACTLVMVIGLITILSLGRVRERLLGSASGTSRIHSLAVIPFTSSNNNSEMDYLGDGLSEEITNSLSRLPNLRVLASGSVSRYRSQGDPQGMGRILRVDAVLTGRVVEHGSELSVETELVDISSGAQLWGERYTRDADHAYLLRSAITHDIAAILRPQLGRNERKSLTQVGTTNVEAYRLYLRGRYAFESWTPEGLKAAADFFERAAAMDPNFAAAHAGLADVYAVQGYMGYISGPELMERAQSAAHRALELDAQIAESHAALANLDLNYFWNFPEAEQEIQKALALDPNSAYAHEVSCWIKVSMGGTQAGLAECRRAVELDPLSGSKNLSLAFEYYWARDYNHAIEQANKTLELGVIYPQALVALAMAHEGMGDYKQAILDWTEAARLGGNKAPLKRVYDDSGYRGFLKEAAKYQESRGRYYYAAREYARLGDNDAAVADLEKVFANRAGVRNMKVDPAFDSLRSDPRFASLLRRIGFPQ
jgi:DNA-binding winged helix-turn-helix (wHTH) protein/TolB-like protein